MLLGDRLDVGEVHHHAVHRLAGRLDDLPERVISSA
jgi:hypothetical protein